MSQTSRQTACGSSEQYGEILSQLNQEEVDIIEDFWKCYGVIVQHCNQAEQDINNESNIHGLTMILAQSKQHRLALHKVCSYMCAADVQEVSPDLMSLRERTTSRLENVITNVEARLAHLNRSVAFTNAKKECTEEIDATGTNYSHAHRAQRSASHQQVMLDDDGKMKSISPRHTVGMRDVMANQQIQQEAVLEIDNKFSISSSRFAELAQQKEELEQQIHEARLEVERKSLAASQERQRQMQLEQDLLRTQEEIDAITDTESENSKRTSRRHLARKPDCANHIGEHLHNSDPCTDIDVVAKVFADAITLNKLPVPEPPIFSGNPLEYPMWKSSFDTLVGSKNINAGEKIHYLKRYLDGDAKTCVDGLFLFNTETAYQRARQLLQQRYGSDFVISEAFREKLYDWQLIDVKDSIGLRRFSDFLQQCELAQETITGLQCLNDCRENRRMLAKLPDYLITKWNRVISDYNGYFPSFGVFAAFIRKEADIACNPITSLNAVRSFGTSRRIERNQCAYPEQSYGDNVSSSCSTTAQSHLNSAMCRYCLSSNHKLHKCANFIALTPDERRQFIYDKKLCFGCLQSGHQSNHCKMRKTCGICKGRHPTCLHGDYEAFYDTRDATHNNESDAESSTTNSQPKSDAHVENRTSLHTCTLPTQSGCGAVVPVYLSSVDAPETEVLIYALLDTQSDTTFVKGSVGDSVVTPKGNTTLKLTTLTSTSYVKCSKYQGLQVRGMHSDVRVPLPTTYSTGAIPVQKSHIPTTDTVKQWPHLQHLANDIPQLQKCDVGLLIGYNCPQALAPHECIPGNGNAPYAQKSLLGWSIVGKTFEEHPP